MTKLFSSNRSGYSSGLNAKNVVRVLVTLPLIIIIIGSLSIAFDAAIENLKYTQQTDQILSIVVAARNYAISQPSFAQQPGEDLLDVLVRTKQVNFLAPYDNASAYYNPWHYKLTGKTTSPSVFRIETNVPIQDCRRMAEFFVKSAKSFSIEIIEVEESTSNWREVYRFSDPVLPSLAIIARACGKEERANLAVVFHIR